jgi:hypothetical protein
MSSRAYNKLFVNRNREEGSEKLALGYLANSQELVFAKDQITEFNIPYYTEPININHSGLTESGATGGPFPAAADRIFKSKKNYGKYTPYGDPSDTADGTWFCSWLYKTPDGYLQWTDRYYNPGATVTTSALLSGQYVAHNPIYRDVASTMMIEPGVRYKYVHCGEATANHTINLFAGISSERIVMNLCNWENESGIDASSHNFAPKITKTNSNTNIGFLYKDEIRTEKSVLNFDQQFPFSITLEHDSVYTPTSEFTVAFWTNSSKWQELPTTQLIGNYSSNGGWGLFVQNLSSYPFFVLPETNYGHLLYVNEGLNGYLDQSVQEIPKVPATAAHVAIDFNQHVVVCIEDRSGIIYKLDSFGKIIAHSKQTHAPFQYVFFTEVPLQMMIGIDNTVIVRTSRMIYTFDEQLNLIAQLATTTTANDVMAVRWDSSINFYELNIAYGVLDSKFIETTQWLISADGNLYKKREEDAFPEKFYEFHDKAKKLNIDPFNRLWVMHGNNLISVFESNAAPFDFPLFSLSIGDDINHPVNNLNFFCQFDPVTEQRKWLCAVYYSNENFIHIIEMNGAVIKVIDMFSLFNASVVQALDQTSDQFKFLGKGDFTGYEHKRVFKNLAPYSNQNQLVLKLALQNSRSDKLIFDHVFQKCSLNSWKNATWQHVIMTLKHQTFDVYVNANKVMSLSLSGKNKLNYNLAPLFYIGSSAGSQSGFNKELQYTSELFRGQFADIKFYDYAIDPKNYELFLREFYKAEDMVWNSPTPDLQHIEKIERLFKHKIPGHKSAFYRIKLKGSHIKDPHIKHLIETQIKQLALEHNPSYVDFLSIEWVD